MLKTASCETSVKTCDPIAGHAVPLEYNMDGLHAINFAKGCYVGQELIARAHYQGAVRKRLMPASIEALDRESHNFPVQGFSRDLSVKCREEGPDAGISRLPATCDS